MAAMDCPHCGETNQEPAAFCESCGKALPSTAFSKPRVVTGDELAATPAGRVIQAGQLRDAARRQAATALFVIGFLNLFIAAILFTIIRFGEPDQMFAHFARQATAILCIVGSIYTGLGFWARKSPFPAAIVGLVFYVTQLLTTAALNPAVLKQGIIVNLLILIALVKAVQAGAKHRQLRERLKSAESTFPVPAAGDSQNVTVGPQPDV